MNSDERDSALTTWNELFRTPEVRMDAADHCDELVRLADKFQRQELISVDEKNALILKATEQYASAVEGLGQGA
ncbi:hypothetical protein D3C77_375950 [compost metagenome]